MSNQPWNRIGIYVVLGLLGWFVLRQWSGAPVNEAVINTAQQTLHISQTYRAQHALDQATIRKLEKQVSTLSKTVDSLDALRVSIVLPDTAPDACKPYAERETLCDHEVKSLRGIVQTQDSIVSTQATALDADSANIARLEKSVADLSKAADHGCRVLGINCPEIGVGAFITPQLKGTLGIGVFIPLHKPR